MMDYNSGTNYAISLSLSLSLSLSIYLSPKFEFWSSYIPMNTWNCIILVYHTNPL